MSIVFSTLSIGYLYELYTRFYIKNLDIISDDNIKLCITSDKDFSNKINSKKVKCYFNILHKNTVNKTHKSDNNFGKTTCFKYFYKSYAIKYAANMFPDSSICHTDCDIIPNKEFQINRFFKFEKPNTLYCPNTVSCSGGYGDAYSSDNKTIEIKPKLKEIMNYFIPEFTDYKDIRLPIENILYFNQIPNKILLKFCDDWLKIGSFSDSKGYSTYGDCFEIKPACLLNNINIESTSLMPFCDNFKNKFIDLIKKSNFDNDEDLLNILIEKQLKFITGN